jgi:PKD domain
VKRDIVRKILALLFAVGLVSLVFAGSAIGARAQGAPRAATISEPAVSPGLAAPAVSSQGPTCFQSGSSECVSSDPELSQGFASDGDTTGCTFSLEINWGDSGAPTTDSLAGGPDGTAYGPYKHTYDAPGTFTVTWSIDLESNSGSNNCVSSSSTNYFTYFPCARPGQRTGVTLPAVSMKITTLKLTLPISYGELPLLFTSATPAGDDICSVQSNIGELPINIFGWKDALQSVTTATVDFLPANLVSTSVPSCTFAGLQGLANAGATPTLSALSEADNCFLTSSTYSPTGVVARWSSPGFQVTADGDVLHTTQPLTYYVDLGALGGSDWSAASFEDTLQAVETYVHLTLIHNLPMIDKIVGYIDPPASLQVKDPEGQVLGVLDGGKNKTFPGAGYRTQGKVSIAWIIDPTPGSYSVTASGPARESFTTQVIDLQFLGHGTHPLSSSTTWKGKLGSRGTASSNFTVHGSSLAPVVLAHESGTRARVKAVITFNLKGSDIPFSAASVVWSFGDGSKADGASAKHAYVKAGRYTPSVTVKSRLGTVATVHLPAITIRG